MFLFVLFEAQEMSNETKLMNVLLNSPEFWWFSARKKTFFGRQLFSVEVLLQGN